MSQPNDIGILGIYDAMRAADDDRCCYVAPSPRVAARLYEALDQARSRMPAHLAGLVAFRPEHRVGFNDGLTVPGRRLPLGAPALAARNVALEKDRLTGDVRVIVVLVDFPDKVFSDPVALKKRFQKLFFASGASGSVLSYYKEVSGKKVRITGDVAGPFRMPMTISEYAHGKSGTGDDAPNARTMARDAAAAANAVIDFKPYDNNRDGYVEAFIIVHAGGGAEETGKATDIWSHKWVLSGDEFRADGVSLFAYLTIPEDAKLGVCAHELGHLLFGFPDLYDTSYRSEGVGNWCLMGGGSWLGGGDVPCHPSAWCKSKQDWVSVTNVTSNGRRVFKDVKDSNEVVRLWRRGAASNEYFLAEHRIRTLFDRELPGEGLLIWRIDESAEDNANALRPKVALLQADGKKELERRSNRGDAGDPFPGSTRAVIWDGQSNPNSLSYGGIDTEVSITNVSVAGKTVTADVTVTAAHLPAAKQRGRDVRPKRPPARPKSATRPRRTRPLSKHRPKASRP